MNSPRHRAGSRRNKHLPIARQTCKSDRAVARLEGAAQRYARYAHLPWLVSDQRLYFHRVGSMFHDPAQGSKPSHSFRAVNIATCFGARLPAGDSVRAAAARRAGDCGRSAAPLTVLDRVERYERQLGHPFLTARQARRVTHKASRTGERLRMVAEPS